MSNRAPKSLAMPVRRASQPSSPSRIAISDVAHTAHQADDAVAVEQDRRDERDDHCARQRDLVGGADRVKGCPALGRSSDGDDRDEGERR